MSSSGPRCAGPARHVTFKVGPPVRAADNEVGFSRMNLWTLSSLESSEQDQKEKDDVKKHRRYGTMVKGSLAPVTATDENFEAAYSVKLQLQIWQDALKEELRFYRSLVIASEILLQRVAGALEGRRQPSLLSTATALTVWHYFLPLLGGYEELARGVLDEITHAIYISPAKSFNIDSSAAAYARLTFFDSFFGLADSYNFHRERATKFKRMAAHEGRVLDRAVDHWQRSYALRLLKGWRGYTYHIAKLRLKYKKVFQKANSGLVVRSSLRLWRRHAHVLRLEQLANQNSKANEQLRAAHQLQRQAQDRLKLVQEESKRKERAHVDTTASKTKLTETYEEIAAKVAAYSKEYLRLRRVWVAVVTDLFGDVHQVPINRDYLLWSSELVIGRRGGRAGGGHHAAFVDSGTTTASENEGSDFKLTPGTIRALVSALRPNGASSSVSTASQDHLSPAQIKGDDAEKAIKLFEEYTGGCVSSPLQPHEVVRGDVLRIRYFLLCLMDMYSGGYVSAFFPNHGVTMGVATMGVATMGVATMGVVPHLPTPGAVVTIDTTETAVPAVREAESLTTLHQDTKDHHGNESGSSDQLLPRSSGTVQSTTVSEGGEDAAAMTLRNSPLHPRSPDGVVGSHDSRFAGFNSKSTLTYTSQFEDIPVNETTLQSALTARRRSTLTDLASGRRRVVDTNTNVNTSIANTSTTEGSSMTHDWNYGMQLLQRNQCASRREVDTLAELTQFGEQMQLEQQGQRFFDFASTITSSGQVPRDVISDALTKFVSEEDLEVADMSFPQEGISSISELVSYASDIAALISKTPQETLRLLEDCAEVSEAMTFVICTKDDDVELVVASFGEEIARAFEHYAKPPTRAPATVPSTSGVMAAEALVMGEEAILQFIAEYSVPVAPSSAMELVDSLKEVTPEFDRASFVIWLCALAVDVDPSPFFPLAHKLNRFLVSILGS